MKRNMRFLLISELGIQNITRKGMRDIIDKPFGAERKEKKMINVKEVDYDEINCSLNQYAVCPYCGEENEIVLEGENDGDEEESECGNCEKTFMYTTRISVDFDTEPIENYYLRERERRIKRIERYESDSELHRWAEEMIHSLKIELKRFDQWMKRIIEN